MKKLGLLLIAVAMTLVFAMPALADPPPDTGPPVFVTICHAAGLAEDPANFVELTLPENAVYGQAGHFNENGTPQAGHEEDILGPCPTTSPSPEPSESPSPTPSPTVTPSPEPSPTESPSPSPEPSPTQPPTTSPPPSEAPPTEPSEGPTTGSPPASPRARPRPAPGKLAFTGWDDVVPLGALALLLLAAGTYLLRRGSREDRAQRNRGV